MAFIDEVEQYLRVDGTDEDAQVQSLIDAAETYLTNAGIAKNEAEPLYKLAAEMLVVHWYENREPIGQAGQIVFGLSAIIAQLKYCYSTEATT